MKQHPEFHPVLNLAGDNLHEEKMIFDFYNFMKISVFINNFCKAKVINKIYNPIDLIFSRI